MIKIIWVLVFSDLILASNLDLPNIFNLHIYFMIS